MAELKENSIEWYTGQDTITVSFTQKKYINKVKKLAQKHPNLVSILSENEDGSIFAHLPLKALKLSLIIPKEREFEDDYDGSSIVDITMCEGKGCPIAYKCFRHNAKANPYGQSYFIEAPYKDGECKEYLKEAEWVV